MHVSALKTAVFAASCLAVAACARSSPQPPVVTPPSGSETVRGNERLGWDQPAGDTAELAGIRYAVYVDGARRELSGVTCGNTAGANGFACTAPLPSMTTGSHTLELAAFVQDGSLLESARSSPLSVTVTGALTESEGRALGPAGASASSSSSVSRGTAPDWPAAARRLAAGLDRAADLAILPDGAMLIAERSGRVRLFRDGRLQAEPAFALADAGSSGAFLAIAADPQFPRTRFVYAIHTGRARSGALTFTLARYRESGGTLGDRIVLLDDIVASTDPHASLRFGPDGKLYAAFDDGGGGPQAMEDMASFNGKILRLNPDGTTPADQPRGSPILRIGSPSPRGLDWHRSSSHLWTGDATGAATARWTARPAAIAAHDDNLFVAWENGLLRARVDRIQPARLARVDDILRGVAVEAVAVASDGRVYFATADALGALTR